MTSGQRRSVPRSPALVASFLLAACGPLDVGGAAGGARSGGSSSGGSGSSGAASSSSGSASSSGGASSSSGVSSSSSGATTVSVDAGGAGAGLFVADAHYSGGDTYSTTSAIDTSGLTGDRPDAAVFQTERYGDFTYTIPGRAPGTAQAVTLYFAESYWTAAGQRTFDVVINGATVLSGFDIFAEAGGANRAIARTFTASADAGGKVVVQFSGSGVDHPKVCALSVAGRASGGSGSSGGSSSSGSSSSGGSSGAPTRKTLFDYFLPTPIIGGLTSTGWGARNVQPRDQDNGLEDRTMRSWSYWDGRIVKGSDGRYHLFASRWAQAEGHWGGWPGSSCVHAVSESSPLGPYVDRGLCYADAGGKGHNVMANQLADGSYFLLVSETRQPAPVYSATSLDGPWTPRGVISVNGNGLGTEGTSSNTSFWPNPDGSILATSRNGIMMVSTGGIAGPYVVKTRSVYASLPFTPGGTPEDPCLWYSGGQYHMIYSYPLDRKMYHLTSPDGIGNWKNMGLAVDATKPFIRYTDGTTNVWNKLERPQVYLEDGHVKYFTFAAIDVDKGDDRGNDAHGSKIIVVPFDGVAFDADTGVPPAAGGASAAR